MTQELNNSKNKEEIMIGDQKVVVKDYTNKDPNFIAKPEYEKYYINKRDWVVQIKEKTKGNEKKSMAVDKLIQKRNLFKNKYERLSYIDDHF